MDIERLFLICCGFEDDGQEIRLFLEGPNPSPNYDRAEGKRSNLFYLFSSHEAEAIRAWLSTRKAWHVLRVPPPYTKEGGIEALRIARSWATGRGSPLLQLASERRIRGEEHRADLRAEVNALIGDVIENPVHRHEYTDLSLLREIIATAPLNVELATAREVWPQQDR